jgi:hypothetical protein
MKKTVGTNVKVTADKSGNVVIKSSNPEYGNIRVVQERIVTDHNGFLRPKSLSALIPGTIDVLSRLGWQDGDEIEGKIIVKESLEPFNKKDPESDLKVAGDSGIVCSVDSKPIYRKNMWTTNESEKDTLIAHTNGAEIQAAYAVMKEEKTETVDTTVKQTSFDL